MGRQGRDLVGAAAVNGGAQELGDNLCSPSGLLTARAAGAACPPSRWKVTQVSCSFGTGAESKALSLTSGTALLDLTVSLDLLL